MEEALFSHFCLFCVGLTGVNRIDETVYRLKLVPVVTRRPPWFPLLAPATDAPPSDETVCTKVKSFAFKFRLSAANDVFK